MGLFSRCRRGGLALHRPLLLERLEGRDLLSAVTVNANQVVRPVNDQVRGVNVAWWDSNLSTGQTKQMVQDAGLRLFRFPGGSSSDEFHFNDPPSYNGRGTVPGMASFIASVGGGGMATVDYGSGSPQEAAALLAYLNAPVTATAAIGPGQQWDGTANAWVQKDWRTAGYWAGLRAAAPLTQDDGLNFLRLGRTAPLGVHYFEIGNEIYGDWEVDHHGQGGDSGQAHHPATYVAFARQFAAYAHEIDPTISIGVDVGGADAWTADMLQQCASQSFTPGFLSDHSYMQNPGAESDAGLLLHTVSDPANTTLAWASRAAGYRSVLQEELAAAAAGVELLATEFNSVWGNPGKQTTSLVNGLFVADCLGSILQTEYNGALFWDLRNSWDTGNNNSPSLYGWRQGGDFGMLGSSNGPPPSTGLYVPHPTYFAEQLVSKMAHSGDSVVRAASDDPNLSVYAVRQANGHLDLLAINKSATTDLTATVAIAGFQPDASAQVSQYGKAQDTAQSQTTDGHSSLASSTATLQLNGSAFSFTFPSYSMTVLDLSPGLPPGWTDADVGSPARPGSAGFSGATWTVCGGGADIAGRSDQFNFASRRFAGDGVAIARVASLTRTDPSAKAGIMFRDSAAANARFVDVVVTPGRGVAFQWRSATGGKCSSVQVTGVTAPKWVKLVRSGNRFTASYSGDGKTWKQIGAAQAVGLRTAAQAGLAVTARNNRLLATATFTNVSIASYTHQVSLAGSFNRTGIFADRVRFAGGLDGQGYGLSGTLLGRSQNWSGQTFALGAAGSPNVVQAVKQTIALPAGSFSRLMLLATAVNGSQSDLAFTVRYTDGTSTTRRQSFSDWTSPPHHPGESVALSMRYRNKKNGAKDNRATYVYGYVFNLDTSKLVASITLPYNRNLNLLAIDLAP